MLMCVRNQLYSVLLLQLLIVVFTSAVSAQSGSGSSDGSFFNCMTQDPASSEARVHDPSNPPAWIAVSSATFYPGQEISVNLISTYPLKSYMLQARSDVSGGVDSWTTGGPHGWWPKDPQSFRCLSAADTVYYSSENLYVTKVKAVWTTNSANLPKDIYFRASILAADGQIWTNIKSSNLKQIKQSDITTQPAKTRTTRRPAPGSTIRSSSNSTPSVVYRIRQNIVDEKIIELNQRHQQLLKSDDYGNEGEWTVVREKERVDHRNYIRLQLVANKKKKQDDEQQRQEILRFEVADREANARVEGGGASDATKLPPKPIDSGAGVAVDRNAAFIIFTSLFTWFYTQLRNNRSSI